MKLRMIGCSHHQSSVSVRERLAFNPQQATEALKCWQLQFPNTELVLLSTCNRTELYAAVNNQNTDISHQQLVQFVTRFHDLPLDDVIDDLLHQSDEDAVKHLFTVAASLDSMVIGEAQILSQVKVAYEVANKNQCTGPITHDVFQAALKVAKRVAHETTINQRRVSIPSVAVADFAKDIFERFDDKKILILGAGEMGEETLRYLMDEGAKDITVLNRSLKRAEELATRWQGKVKPWDSLSDEMIAADLVVSTTGAVEPIITLDDFRQIESQRYQRPLFILDLAIPRDFDPAIGDCLGVYLYCIDDLQQVCEENKLARQSEWSVAEKIIIEETALFMRDMRHRSTAPTIRQLRESCHQLKEDELIRLMNKLPDLDQRVVDELERSFDRLVNKLLHPPLESLRDEAEHGAPHFLVDALKKLFQLKD